MPLLLGEACKNTRKTSKLLVVFIGTDRRMARLNVSFSAMKFFCYEVISMFKGMDINFLSFFLRLGFFFKFGGFFYVLTI